MLPYGQFSAHLPQPMHQSSMMISREFEPADRVDRAADHAVRVEARPARAGDQELVEPEPLADQAGDAVVGVGAGLGALVAAGALLQVEHQQALGVEQALAEELGERQVLDLVERRGGVLEPLDRPAR